METESTTNTNLDTVDGVTGAAMLDDHDLFLEMWNRYEGDTITQGRILFATQREASRRRYS